MCPSSAAVCIDDWFLTWHVVQNISAPFICAVPPFKATLDKAIGMADFLFGNEIEAAAFAESEGWETTDVSEIALKISQRKKDKKNTTVVCHFHLMSECCTVCCTDVQTNYQLS
jgi:sugar/nucleoside kinase (ribokinase family)